MKAGPSAAICSAVITHLHVLLEVRSAGSLIGLEPIQRCSANSWSVNEDLCAANADRDCHEKVRRETLTGDDHSSLISVNRPNSIENRLIKLLQYLDANYPQEGWGSFLDAGAVR